MTKSIDRGAARRDDESSGRVEDEVTAVAYALLARRLRDVEAQVEAAVTVTVASARVTVAAAEVAGLQNARQRVQGLIRQGEFAQREFGPEVEPG